ncbi:MAG: lipocalin-like domain-containing protein [bacterium]
MSEGFRITGFSRRFLFAMAGATLVLIMVSILLVKQLPNRTAKISASPLSEFLSSDAKREFKPVTPGYRLRFPEDHGAHLAFRQEWWYFTGNLIGEDDQKYGFQLTFFRFAHARNEQLPATGWNNDQTWMAHFAVTDVARGKFYAEEDFARGAIDLAGAEAHPFSVWINGWSALGTYNQCGQCLSARLKAQANDIGIDLEISSNQRPVLQGDKGYSTKNHNGDIASYYYSYPDLKTTGNIMVGGNSVKVQGLTWMDREWSSAVLAKGQTGWDWFALHLDDGRKLMLFQVRDDVDGDFRHAVLIERGGDKTLFPPDEIEMTATKFWISPQTGNRYPVQWLVKNKSSNRLNITIEPKLENQELDLTFQYYEGAVDVSGTLDNQEVSGSGYMELTGYEYEP